MTLAVRSLEVLEPVRAFGKLPLSLTSLTLSACTLRSLPAGLPTTLRRLDLSWNPELFRKEDPSALRKLTNLKMLDVRHTGIDSVHALDALFASVPLLCDIRL